MRRWLRVHGNDPIMGDEPSTSEKLMKQVLAAGGNPDDLMAEGRKNLDELLAMGIEEARKKRLDARRGRM